MEVIANEVRYVENLLESKKLNPKRVTKDIRLIVQYYLVRGESPDEILNKVILFINEVNGDSSGERWKRTIKGAIKDLLKKNDLKMREVDKITFTKNEIEAIKTLKTKNQKKCAWGLLVLCKIINNGKESRWVTIEHLSKFCRMVGVNTSTSKKRGMIFNELLQNGLIKVSFRTGSESIEVLFEDKVEGEITISTYNKFTKEENYFHNAMLLFEKLFLNKKVYECKVCKTQVPITTKTRKYCEVCAEEVKRGRIKIIKNNQKYTNM